MDSNFNPYASPEALPERMTTEQRNAQAWLNGAGLALVLLGLAHLLMSPFILFAGVAGLYRMYRGPFEKGDESFVIVSIVFVAVSILGFIRALIMIVGGIQLRSQQRYRWALASAIATICGIFFPLLWLDVPFGIWAFILLRKTKYKQLFET